MADWFVDFTAGSNGSGTSAGSPINSPANLVSAAPSPGDKVYCVNTLAGALALSTLAGTSLAFPLTFIGVTNLSTKDMSSRTIINASGQSAALTGSGSYLMFHNFDFRNSTGQTHQHSGANLTFINCDFRKGTGSASSAINTYDQYVDGCRFYNYSGTAVTLAGVSGSSLQNCYFEGCAAGVVGIGYRTLNLDRNAFVTISGDAISIPGNGNIGTAFGIKNNTFYGIGGSAIVIDGSGNGEIHAHFNIFDTVTGTGIKVTNSPSSTTVSAHKNYFYATGTNLGTHVKDNGLNVTLGSSPLTSPPTDVTVTSGSGLRGTWWNQASFGGMQIGAGGGGGGIMGHGLDGGF